MIILGIDTSNYKTSAALCSTDGRVLGDKRKFLTVRQGERGLRQSNALFQHVENLPQIIRAVLAEANAEQTQICAVAASASPRNAEGSYMPCFNAGVSTGKSIAAVLGVPFYETSHQEGHIAAILNTIADVPSDFLTLQLSGGTCELLRVGTSHLGYQIEIIGGSKDISYGQVLDRVGVSLGMAFPCGEEMDDIAIKASYNEKRLKPVAVDGSYINLSGIETQAQRLTESVPREELICELFDRISDSIYRIVKNASAETGLETVVFAGGVSSSRYISKRLSELAAGSRLRLEFGNQIYSSDNAVGVALIGGKRYGNEAR